MTAAMRQMPARSDKVVIAAKEGCISQRDRRSYGVHTGLLGLGVCNVIGSI